MIRNVRHESFQRNPLRRAIHCASLATSHGNTAGMEWELQMYDVWVVIAQEHDRSGSKLIGVFDDQETAEAIVAAMKAGGSMMKPILLCTPRNKVNAQEIA
jgi:hypothetical protein